MIASIYGYGAKAPLRNPSGLDGGVTLPREDASRVEVWAAVEGKKSQRAAINWPARPCALQGLVEGIQCPDDPRAVLEASYGPRWCVPCKSRSSNCKD
jgi:hypothetical protein